MSIRGEVTRLLEAYGRGDAQALDRLLPLVYEELRRLAHQRRYSWRGEPSPGTTSLVHEAYLNLVDHATCQYQDRRHFFYFASVTMRNILIDNARRRGRRRRGGDRVEVPLEDQELVSEARGEELLALDEALGRLRKSDERLARIVECRFFGGFSIEETGEILTLSPATVKRGWITARTWLYKELKQAPAS